MYIKKVVVVGLLLATVSASHGASRRGSATIDYRDVALSAYPLLADATKNAAAVEELHKVGACLEGYQDTDPSQTAALALALGGKGHGLPGLEAFYGTATTESVVAGWVPSRESAATWASDHSRGLALGGAAVAAVAGVGAGYRFGWGSKLKGMLPGRK